MTLIAFHGKQEIKDKYVARMKAHKLADEIIHGDYWDGAKGCAVGCTLHSGKHSDYETELGVPRLLATLEDGIFESLRDPRDKEWPLQFLETIPIGADLSNVWTQFAVWMLIDEKWGVLQFAKTDRTKESIKAVAKFYSEGKFAKKEHWDEIAKIRATATASASAAAAYDYAAATATASASAAAYAYAAASASAAATATASAYDAYAASAYAAPTAADRQKWREAQADKLLELMANAPVLRVVGIVYGEVK